jgi:hypothetical protein
MYRGINEFKKFHQPRNNLVKEERGNLFVDAHKILNSGRITSVSHRTYTGAGGVRQTEMHTAEPFVPEPSATKFEVAIGKPKKYRSPAVDQVPAELIQAGEETLHSEIHKLIKLIWNKELPYQWKESTGYLFTKRVIKLTVVIIEAYHCCQLHTKLYQTFFLLG